jgi:hypothetical protein
MCHVVKRYNKDVPPYLHNRPKAFIEHCLHRLANAEEIETLQKVSEGVYSINGYITKLGTDSEMPFCNCIDWKSNHWPCKHLFKAIAVGSWNDLSVLIRHSQYLTIDNYCIDVNLMDVSEGIAVTTHRNEMRETNVVEVPEIADVAGECRELLQEIITCTYSDLTVDCFQTLRNSLSVTLKTLRSVLPSEHGLAFLPRKRKRHDKHIKSAKRRLNSEVDKSNFAPQMEIQQSKNDSKVVDVVNTSDIHCEDSVERKSSTELGTKSISNDTEALCNRNTVPVLNADVKETNGVSSYLISDKDDCVIDSRAEVQMASIAGNDGAWYKDTAVPVVNIDKQEADGENDMDDEDDCVIDSTGGVEMTRSEENESDELHEGYVSIPESTDSNQDGSTYGYDLSDEVLIVAATEHESQLSTTHNSQFRYDANGDEKVTPIEIHDEDNDSNVTPNPKPQTPNPKPQTPSTLLCSRARKRPS